MILIYFSEWGDLESGAPIAPSSAADRTKISEQTSSDSSTSADNHLPQVTLSASDTTDSSSDSLKSVPSSDSTQEKQSAKTEAQPTVESVTPEKIRAAPSVRPESEAPETSTSAIESESESRTLTTEKAGKQPASTTAEGEKESTKIGEKAESTEQSSGSDSTTEEPEVVQVIPATRDKGDLVLVGSDRNTPSSDSSQSKGMYYIYYPPEVNSIKYCCFGVFRRNTSGSSLNIGNRQITLKYWCSWVVKKRKTSEAVPRPQYTP